MELKKDLQDLKIEDRLNLNRQSWVEYWENQYPTLKGFVNFEKLEIGRERYLKVLAEIFKLEDIIPEDYLFEVIKIRREDLISTLEELKSFLDGEINYMRGEVETYGLKSQEQSHLLLYLEEIKHFEKNLIELLSFDGFVYGNLSPYGIMFRITFFYLKAIVELRYKDPYKDLDDKSFIGFYKNFIDFKMCFIESIVSQYHFWY